MGTRAGGTPDKPAVFFDTAADFHDWLADHHATATELWMGLTKRHVSPRGLTWEDAVPEALIWGWIDSVVQRIDDDTSRQRWTPRKRTSTWSAVNVAHVERLIAQGRMQPAGLAAYRARRPERTAVYSYEAEPLHLPPTYAERLAAAPLAQAFWDGATAGYRRIAVHWFLGAKQPVTRDKRLDQLIADSAAGRLIPSQRYGAEPAWVARLRADLGIE